ncbi:MAG: hypothetical protein KAR38_15840 [Calditrichia bacterium]|nr:hypothetical protein [Calditrichia bacterium]
MKKILIALLLLIIGSFTVFGQVDKKKNNDAFQDLDDAVVEVKGEGLALYFFNALNGETLSDAQVEIERIGTFKSDLAGRVRFPAPEEGGIYMIQFKKDGFITSKFQIEIEAGSLFFNNRFSISPIMNIEYLRIIVDWGKRPKDLDAHLVKESSYHISYQDMHVSNDGYGVLDRDDRTSYGPETITIKKVDNNALYKFFIHDYSNRNKDNSNKLSKSKVSVKVYGNGQLLHVFHIPQHQTGNYWNVFNIRNGKIVKINQVTKTN